MSTYARTGLHSHNRTDGRTKLGREQKRLRAKWDAALKAKESVAIAKATATK